jgi:hypothetical protein
MKEQLLPTHLCLKDIFSYIRRFFCKQLKFKFIGRSLLFKKSTFLSVLAASTGKSPLVVYPDVIVASVKSNTAFVVSETSALVGLGFVYIDYSI